MLDFLTRTVPLVCNAIPLPQPAASQLGLAQGLEIVKLLTRLCVREGKKSAYPHL